jgi:hypothetical protein
MKSFLIKFLNNFFSFYKVFLVERRENFLLEFNLSIYEHIIKIK